MSTHVSASGASNPSAPNMEYVVQGCAHFLRAVPLVAMLQLFADSVFILVSLNT